MTFYSDELDQRVSSDDSIDWNDQLDEEFDDEQDDSESAFSQFSLMESELGDSVEQFYDNAVTLVANGVPIPVAELELPLDKIRENLKSPLDAAELLLGSEGTVTIADAIAAYRFVNRVGEFVTTYLSIDPYDIESCACAETAKRAALLADHVIHTKLPELSDDTVRRIVAATLAGDSSAVEHVVAHATTGLNHASVEEVKWFVARLEYVEYFLAALCESFDFLISAMSEKIDGDHSDYLKGWFGGFAYDYRITWAPV